MIPRENLDLRLVGGTRYLTPASQQFEKGSISHGGSQAALQQRWSWYSTTGQARRRTNLTVYATLSSSTDCSSSRGRECQFAIKPTGGKACNCIGPKATRLRDGDLRSHNIPHGLSMVPDRNEMTYICTWGDIWAKKHQCHYAIRYAGELCFCSFFIFIHLLPLVCTKWVLIRSPELTHPCVQKAIITPELERRTEWPNPPHTFNLKCRKGLYFAHSKAQPFVNEEQCTFLSYPFLKSSLCVSPRS